MRGKHSNNKKTEVQQQTNANIYRNGLFDKENTYPDLL